jgi:hypothetical protein
VLLSHADGLVPEILRAIQPLCNLCKIEEPRSPSCDCGVDCGVEILRDLLVAAVNFYVFFGHWIDVSLSEVEL